ncbi:hypothetical protein C4B63_84g84 [Trypanosoma cruzi]|uniref:Uncharacterized protein n=1 Tax=Trypanosoma cruzi TaxID=5693 RepID=A0A2V2UUQ9_TRYCR|nr:hypothetical protein C4B63_84g84 [Trypanosoma cruzi]
MHTYKCKCKRALALNEPMRCASPFPSFLFSFFFWGGGDLVSNVQERRGKKMEKPMNGEKVRPLQVLPRNSLHPAGLTGGRHSVGSSGICSRSGSSYVVDFSASPPTWAAPGAGCVTVTQPSLPPVDGTEPQHRRMSPGHGATPSRTSLMVVPEETVGEDEDTRDSFSSSSSAYMRHHRYENPFTAYQPVSDPYDRHREIERQRRFINDSKRLGRPFIPSGGRALEKPTRYLLGDCVAAIYRTIGRDWPETDPMVISTAEDLVVVYMKRARLRSTDTVLRYMNASLKRNEAVRAFDLRKVPEGWDLLTDDGHIMYTFKPPWVRQRRFLPDQVVTRKAH